MGITCRPIGRMKSRMQKLENQLEKETGKAKTPVRKRNRKERQD